MEITVSIGDTACTIGDEGGYSPDVLEDWARIARDTVITTQLSLERLGDNADQG